MVAPIPLDKQTSRRRGGPETNVTPDTVFRGNVQMHISLSRLSFATASCISHILVCLIDKFLGKSSFMFHHVLDLCWKCSGLTESLIATTVPKVPQNVCAWIYLPVVHGQNASEYAHAIRDVEPQFENFQIDILKDLLPMLKVAYVSVFGPEQPRKLFAHCLVWTWKMLRKDARA